MTSAEPTRATDGAETAQATALRIGSSRRALAVYQLTRSFIRWVLFPWFRVRVSGREHLNHHGPVIVAPVHRSNLDSPLVAALGERRMRALAKESLFGAPVLGWYVTALGAFPVRRGSADRESMQAARTLLDQGEMMIVFPEGTRQQGDEVATLFDGTGYLAAKSQALVVPVGIGGTGEAMPTGARFPRRTPVSVVVGPPLQPPAGRAPRSQLRAFTEELHVALSDVQRRAVADLAR
jgi:1-acyl-sn-glycerol-3-phosphate acyltransferase